MVNVDFTELCVLVGAWAIGMLAIATGHVEMWFGYMRDLVEVAGRRAARFVGRRTDG